MPGGLPDVSWQWQDAHKLRGQTKKNSPDIDLASRFEETDMRAMNDLFRSYGNFDVVAGRFSFFSEISVRNGHITGYVKPLF